MASDEQELMNSCRFGNSSMVQRILSKNKNIDINWSDMNGWTCLYAACSIGKMEIVDLLLKDSSIDISKKTNSGNTPFIAACMNGVSNIVHLMLNNPKFTEKEINDCNKYGGSGFFYACKYGHTAIVKMLIKDERVNVTTVTIDGETPLRGAIANEQVHIINELSNSLKFEVTRK